MACDRSQILAALNRTYVQVIGSVGAFGHADTGLKWICLSSVRVSPWKPREERKIGRKWIQIDHCWIRYNHNPLLPRLNKGDKILLNAWVTEYTRADGTLSYGFNAIKYFKLLEQASATNNKIK
jgi:hypothetical protein